MDSGYTGHSGSSPPQQQATASSSHIMQAFSDYNGNFSVEIPLASLNTLVSRRLTLCLWFSFARLWISLVAQSSTASSFAHWILIELLFSQRITTVSPNVFLRMYSTALKLPPRVITRSFSRHQQQLSLQVSHWLERNSNEILHLFTH